MASPLVIDRPQGEEPSLAQETPNEENSVELSMKGSFLRKATASHSKLPGIRRIPLPAIGIILLIALINVAVWIGVAIVLRFHTALASTAVLSYTLGLRHALDADHISAIDLMTRRLIASGQRPVTVGTFFSLGHSTIVVITSIVVAATAAAVSDKFNAFGTVGGIIGSSVSATFLIVLGLMNMYILYKLIKQMQKVLSLNEGEEEEAWKVEGGGCLFQVLKKMFKLINRPWKMYPLGILFGLGFDTSSEIALLGISSIQATKGTSIWVILIFPILFTAGMCLIDTMDGALMLTLYILPSTSSKNPDRARDPITFLYYSIVLTMLTVVVAIIIGVLQLLTMIDAVAEPKGKFWEGVEVAGEYYDIIGGVICGSFVVVGLISVAAYKPWRRRVDRRRVIRQQGDQIEIEDEEGGGDGSAVLVPHDFGTIERREGLAFAAAQESSGGKHEVKGSKAQVQVRSREELDEDEILRIP